MTRTMVVQRLLLDLLSLLNQEVPMEEGGREE